MLLQRVLEVAGAEDLRAGAGPESVLSLLTAQPELWPQDSLYKGEPAHSGRPPSHQLSSVELSQNGRGEVWVEEGDVVPRELPVIVHRAHQPAASSEPGPDDSGGETGAVITQEVDLAGVDWASRQVGGLRDRCEPQWDTCRVRGNIHFETFPLWWSRQSESPSLGPTRRRPRSFRIFPSLRCSPVCPRWGIRFPPCRRPQTFLPIPPQSSVWLSACHSNALCPPPSLRPSLYSLSWTPSLTNGGNRWLFVSPLSRGLCFDYCDVIIPYLLHSGGSMM